MPKNWRFFASGLPSLRRVVIFWCLAGGIWVSYLCFWPQSIDSGLPAPIFQFDSDSASVYFAMTDQIRRIIAASSDGQIIAIDIDSLQVTALGRIGEHGINCIAISPHGKYLAFGNWDGRVTIWDPSEAKSLYSINAHRLHISSLSFGDSDNALVTASLDGMVKLWNLDAKANAEAAVLYDGGIWVGALAASKDRKLIAWGDASGKMLIYSFLDRRISWQIQHNQSINAMSLMPDGNTLVASSNEGTVVVGIRNKNIVCRHASRAVSVRHSVGTGDRKTIALIERGVGSLSRPFVSRLVCLEVANCGPISPRREFIESINCIFEDDRTARFFLGDESGRVFVINLISP